MIIIGLILFVALFWGVPELDRLIRRDRISQSVKFCSTTDTLTFRRDFFRLTKQYTEKISEKYQILDDDAQNIDIIIDDFKNDIIKKHFANKVKYISRNYDNCFLIYLRDYMVQNQYEMSIGDYEIYKHENSVDNGGLWRNRFAITDFGISFHKLLFLLHVWYVDYKKITDISNGLLLDIEEIKKHIDNRFLITYN
jgi:hypothetical protein